MIRKIKWNRYFICNQNINNQRKLIKNPPIVNKQKQKPDETFSKLKNPRINYFKDLQKQFKEF